MAKPLSMATKSPDLHPGGAMSQNFLLRSNLCLLLLGVPGPNLAQNDSVSVEGGWWWERPGGLSSPQEERSSWGVSGLVQVGAGVLISVAFALNFSLWLRQLCWVHPLRRGFVLRPNGHLHFAAGVVSFWCWEGFSSGKYVRKICRQSWI